MKIWTTLILSIASFVTFAQWGENQTPTYFELTKKYQELANKNEFVHLFSMGDSDAGLPIYLCVLSKEKDSLSVFQEAQSGTTVLVNNGIHPGEPDGINASVEWIENWIKTGSGFDGLPNTIAFIPTYNVGGTLRRNSHSRANQDGPEEYGFRGNAQNLDLNRDFIKMDSKNAWTFATIFHALNPDLFIDTHVSNGADYQYVLTTITGVKQRIAPSMSELIYENMYPETEKSLAERKVDIVPYVSLLEDIPDKGIQRFDDLPRYSMGYAALFNSIGITIETHMLKPFEQRKKATYDYLDVLIHWTGKNSLEIEKARRKAFEYDANLIAFSLDYQLTEKRDSILFKGYESSCEKSKVTGLNRLKYHQDKPFEKWVLFADEYEAQKEVIIPEYFIVKRNCEGVLSRLKQNGVEMSLVGKNVPNRLKSVRIESYQPGKRPYEGHFLHSKAEISIHDNLPYEVDSNDYLISTNQKSKRFILSVLLPQAKDSYFHWNFFDSYLQQKEYFSPYVFEDKAEQILKDSPMLKEELEEKKKSDPQFAESSWSQLYFIYKHSENYEPTHNFLPIILGWD